MTEETTTPTPEPGTRYKDYTFLVGNEVYLRTFEPGDEKNATSWRNSIFPASPERVEKWIKEELPKEGKNDRSHLAIVRKADDVLVGSISSLRETVSQKVHAHVDPLYGDAGQEWLAEALLLYADWSAEENTMPAVHVLLTTDNVIAIERMRATGFVETARHRQMLEKNGQRYDRVNLSWFSRGWLATLGDPMLAELPVSGKGEVAPRPVPVVPEGDPPRNAIMIGARVYLRPQDKKDAKRDIEMGRLEEETFFDIGRQLGSEAQWAEFIGSGASEEYPAALWFAVCLRENDEVIGSVGMLHLDWVNRTGETGSMFHSREYRGNGYGSEAKQLLLEYVFDVLGLHMVTSYVYFPNTRSAAALRKQGYREAGRVCWLYTYQGNLGNMVTFDLLAEEWRALPRL